MNYVFPYQFHASAGQLQRSTASPTQQLREQAADVYNAGRKFKSRRYSLSHVLIITLYYYRRALC